MSLIFSRQCEYALQAVMYLALKRGEKMTSIRELTLALKIPYHFLGKILQELTYKGLLTSSRGPSGGFALSASAKDRTLLDIVDAVDGASFACSCVLGFAECAGHNQCAVHEKWGAIRTLIVQMLVSETISEMAARMERPEYGTARE